MNIPAKRRIDFNKFWNQFVENAICRNIHVGQNTIFLNINFTFPHFFRVWNCHTSCQTFPDQTVRILLPDPTIATNGRI